MVLRNGKKLVLKQPRGPVSVSVIIPAFNRASTILGAVRSLLQQRFSERFEIVVVDDGSSDGTAERVRGIDSAVRILSQTNSGSAAARRAGISAAAGDYVAFLDSDDVARPEHLATLWRAVHSEPRVVAAFALCRPVDSALATNPMLRSLVQASGGVEFVQIDDPLRLLCHDGCVTEAMNIVARRTDALWAATGRDHVEAATDFDFSLRLALRGPFAFAPRQTIDLERRPDGLGVRRARQQASWSVRAIAEAVSLSGRRDVGLRSAARARVTRIWPFAVAENVRALDCRSSVKVLAAGLRFGIDRGLSRRVWWAIRSSRDSPPRT